MNTYKVKMLCRNCKYEFDKDIPKKQEVPVLVMCPNCMTDSAWSKDYLPILPRKGIDASVDK